MFRLNLVRWKALTEEQRDELRATWRRWQGRPAAQRARAETRFAVLQRLQDRLALAGSAQSTSDRLGIELTWELEALTRQLRREVPEAPTDISLTETVDLLFHRRAEAFLDHLQAHGRLQPDERARILALSPAALAEESLQRLKTEQLGWLPPERAAELAGCDPLDVAAHIDELLRREGLLGRAGREWPLSDDERDQLAQLSSTAEVRDALRQMRAGDIRSRLQGNPLTPGQVDALLAAPWNELQRSLDELLASG